VDWALHIGGAYFHAFQANGQIGHVCLEPPKLRLPRAPCFLNPSLVLASEVRNVAGLKIIKLQNQYLNKKVLSSS